MESFYLETHAFLSLGTQHVVILDVLRDRYLCVPRSRFEQLAPRLAGWARRSSACGGDEPHGLPVAAESLARELLSGHILTRDPANSKPVRPAAIATASVEIRAPDRIPLRSVLTGLGAALWACRCADRALRRLSFKSVIGRVEARNRAHSFPIEPASMAKAIRLATVFAALRPLYPRPYLCLFDSLALLEFLARHSIYPRWIFGVRADPFHAHCWVQYGEVLLDDRIHRVSPLAPIMAI